MRTIRRFALPLLLLAAVGAATLTAALDLAAPEPSVLVGLYVFLPPPETDSVWFSFVKLKEDINEGVLSIAAGEPGIIEFQPSSTNSDDLVSIYFPRLDLTAATQLGTLEPKE